MLNRYIDDYKASGFIIEDDDATYIIPGMLRRRMLGMHSFLSLPYGTYGGIIGQQPLPSRLNSTLLEELTKRVGPWMTLTIHPSQEHVTPPGFQKNVLHTHRLALENGWEQVWTEQVHQSMRKLVRRASKKGVKIEETEAKEILGDFLNLMWDLQKRRGFQLPMDTPFWGALFSQPWCRTYRARLEGTTICVLIVLEGKKEAHAFAGATNHDFGKYHPFRLIYAHAIEQACMRGMDTLDMGGNAGLSTLEQFKQGFGAQKTEMIQWRHTPRWAFWRS
jgi:Acetyltransferase (GNAT) domain